MFDINFRIVDDLEYLSNVTSKQFDADMGHIEGFFELNFDGNIEGYYHNNKLHEDEIGLELLTWWFPLVIEAIIILEKESKYVAFQKPDTYNSWLEFILEEDDILKVNRVRDLEEFKEGSRAGVVTVKKDSFTYPEWKNVKISFNEFKNKVKTKGKEFLKEIEKINPEILKSKSISSLSKELDSI